MAQLSAEELGPALGRGPLSFPVTHFDNELEFDERAYRDHVGWLSEIRNCRPGYAVPIIKAGLTAVGRPSSRVRPPLTDLTEAELAELTTLVRTIA
ncbi:hypothetical protein [Nocardia sp. NPDC005998]|uniref:hypothetical protein n=1 Tax=Nocardia sp. NPDC005998 TaxID=3156894 RepID=UPI0033B9DC0B